MQVLITGSSGFLGRSIFEVLGKSFPLTTLNRSNSDLNIDLSHNSLETNKIFNLVIHSAGKAHSVPKSFQETQEFFNVNVKGTKNLLKGLSRDNIHPNHFVFISSVSVYGKDRGTLVNEAAPLNATDPYGQSKIQAEEVIQEWCDKHNVICTILRLPLLVGVNPPGNLGSMINAIRKGYYFNISGGLARKSMVMAEDVAKFILPASEVGGIYNLTDGYHPNFKELSDHIARELNRKAPKNIPSWLAKGLASTGDLLGDRFPFNSYKLSKITSDLTFDDSKARAAFGWNPRPVLETFKL